MLPGLLLAAALALPLDVVLKVDASPVRGTPRLPLEAEVAFQAATPGQGVQTFRGACPWPDPTRPLVHRWKGALAGEGPRTLRHLRYLIKDADGRTLATFHRDPAGKLGARGIGGFVLHFAPGALGEPGTTGGHTLELELRP